MKKYLLFLAMIGASSNLFAQIKEGKIVYEKVMNMHKNLPENMEQMKAMIPEFRKSKTELLFNASQSISRGVKESNIDQAIADGEGRRFRMMMGGGENELFKDYDNETLIETAELGPKKYLISDSLHPMKWKMTGDTATIAGYLCYKATTTISRGVSMGMQRNMNFGPGGPGPGGPGQGGGRNRGGANGERPNRDSLTRVMENMVNAEIPVEVWYAEKIETSAGPENYFGLPGAILKVDMDNGQTVITAIEINEGLGKETVKAPTKGTKITRAEHRKMLEEQMRNMRSMMGGPGGQGGIRVMGGPM